ncbi:LysR family transcriptional regulator [Variovorax dokdonensis]|uniref:LysR family transcriptional regulator n=1 Tax=Variovorax dokdonensis TaxID=344883 RepID=A0ABT7N930_9BURK|nr:LysR family transcriptional regulator [Variovorax dokdonensis]MDM0044449.1 LysR family transcriptional regulator [Variovorax dokdonensis]
MAFDLRHLRCFLAVADEGHFGRAAAKLAMTQPPLSVAIRQLEDTVGVRLIDRSSRGVQITAAGEALVPQARALLAAAAEAVLTARHVGQGARGRLRVGFVGSLLFAGLPQWLALFQEAHPGIEVALVELNSQEQLDAMGRGELDVGFVLARRVPSVLQAVTVHEAPFVACLPAGHPAASSKRLSLERLRDDPFVLFSRQVSPDYHARIIDACAEAGFDPKVRHELRHWLSVVAVVSQGMGVAIVPAPLAQSGMAGVVFRPLSGARVTSILQCVWPVGPVRSPAVLGLLNVVFSAAAPDALARIAGA